jgi:hypothetical protein
MKYRSASFTNSPVFYGLGFAFLVVLGSFALVIGMATTPSPHRTLAFQATPTLSPTFFDPHGPNLPEYQAEAEILQLGDEVTHSLSADQPSYVYQYSAKRGELFRVTVESAIDIHLITTFAEDFSEGDYNQNMGSTTYESRALPAGKEERATSSAIMMHGDSVVWVAVDMGDKQEVLDYTLRLEPIELPVLTYGQTLDLDWDDRSSFELIGEFEGKAGDIIDINVDAVTDTHIALIGFNGLEVVGDDDSGGELNPALYHFVLPADDTYRLVVGMNPGTAVSMSQHFATITLNAVPAETFIGGETYVELKHNIPANVAEMEVKAGQTYRIVADVPSLSAPITMIVVQNGEILDTFDIAIDETQFSSSSDVLVENSFTAKSDGKVRLIFRYQAVPQEPTRDLIALTVSKE